MAHLKPARWFIPTEINRRATAGYEQLDFGPIPPAPENQNNAA
jgi:hypothetical protein